MRKYGSSKRNPNPKWPYEQAVVVVPPGSSTLTAAKINGSAKIMENRMPENIADIERAEVVHSRNDNLQIMGYMDESSPNTRENFKVMKNMECSKIDVSSYLCQSVGSYARIEFLFGENTHVEKTGILESVGKDFVVLTESGTGSQIVSSLKNIKFINLYKINNS